MTAGGAPMTRILIVDDDPQSRRLLSEAVRGLAWEFHCCSDGIHAMDALRCNSGFDAMITDIAMPVLNGRQLMDCIRQDGNLAEIPVLVTSGVTGPSEVARILASGAAAFLAKPLNVMAVRDTLADCLRDAAAAHV